MDFQKDTVKGYSINMETSNINYLESAKLKAKAYQDNIIKEAKQKEENIKKRNKELYDYSIELFNTLKPFNNLQLIDKKCLSITQDDVLRINIKVLGIGGVEEQLLHVYVTAEKKIAVKKYTTQQKPDTFPDIKSFMEDFVEHIHPRILI